MTQINIQKYVKENYRSYANFGSLVHFNTLQKNLIEIAYYDYKLL